MIKVEVDGASHEVAIDYFDRSRVLPEVLERCPMVFKMQFSVEGYASAQVVPGGYVPGRPAISRYLPALRCIHDTSPPHFEVYGRFGSRYAGPTRRTAVQLLSSQTGFRYEGSLVIRPYAAYLREAALSRVCIDLPGNGDMCHRLIDYLAIGCCVVRPLPQSRLHVPLTDGVNVRYVRADLSDLVDTCAELMHDQHQRERLAHGAREHFDRYLRGDQLAGYYLDRCLTTLGTT